MKKSNLLIGFACLGLLLAGCNSKSASSAQGGNSGSSAANTSQPASSNPGQTSLPPEETYYAVPFGEENAAKNGTDGKWGKGAEYSWTFNVPKNYTKVQFAVGAKMSASSHDDRSLFTNHVGASSSDNFESNEANDGTPRIEVKANNKVQELTTKTYGEAELNTSDFVYFKVSEFPVNQGEVTVTLKTDSRVGYRLLLGDGARLYYNASDESADPTVLPEGHMITFVASHCKIYAFKTEAFDTETPELVTAPIPSRDSSGNICQYQAPDTTQGIAEIKPEVNFKIVADENYYADGNNISISGTMGTEWNKICSEGVDIYSVTKIKADITITVTAVAATGNEKAGYEATFNLEHCTVKVYKGKTISESNLDEADANDKFYTRNKDSGELSKAAAQLNFEVVPADGYEFVSGLDMGGESSPAGISFVTGNYGNFKRNGSKGNVYSITKVASNLVLNIKATESQGGSGEDTPGDETEGYEATFSLEHCTVKVYAGQKNAAGDNLDTADKYYTRNGDTGDYTKTDGQINFEVVPANGYEVSNVSVTGGYKNLKGPADLGSPNLYRVTKVSSDITITVTCTLIAG